MTEIFQFPTQSVRDWTTLERTIRDVLRQRDAPPEMITEVCGRMKLFFDKVYRSLSVSFKLPYTEHLNAVEKQAIDDAVSNAFKSIGDQIHKLMNEIISDRVKLEIELYYSRLEK